jgi:hypothetical protein
MASEREFGGFSSPHDRLGGVGEETCEGGWMAEKPFAEEGNGLIVSKFEINQTDEIEVTSYYEWFSAESRAR